MTNLFRLADHRTGCATCGRPHCEGDCPISEVPLLLLMCDLCGAHTRVPAKNPSTPLFLDDWQKQHTVYRSRIDPPSTYGPSAVDPFDAHVDPCRPNDTSA